MIPVRMAMPASPIDIPRYIGFLVNRKTPSVCSFTGVARWLNGVNVFLNILFVSIATYEPKMKGTPPLIKGVNRY